MFNHASGEFDRKWKNIFYLLRVMTAQGEYIKQV